MPTTTIAHLTDPHTSSLSGVGAGALLGKRALGYLSWRRKRRYRHTQEMLEATTAAALAHNPDALVLTGDLVHVGLATELQQIRPWLAALAQQVPVLLVPGNHDLYAADSPAAWQAELGDLPVFGEPAEPGTRWPRRLRVNNCQIIGLSSAYPAPFTRADGRLGQAQQQRLQQLLSSANDTEHTLLALHHPADSALCAERKSLLDAAGLQTLIAEHSVSALLHGHLHENIDYAVGATPCYCTASASSTHAPALASFRLLTFTDSGVAAKLFVADSAEGTPGTRFTEAP